MTSLLLNKIKKEKVGLAYEMIQDLHTWQITLKIYVVSLNNGEYKFSKYKTIKGYDFSALCQLAEDLGAVPLSTFKKKNMHK